MIRGIILLIILVAAGVTVAIAPVIALASIACMTICFLVFQKSEWGIILAAFFLPFERLGSLELYGLTIRLSQVLIILSMLSFFIHGSFRKKITIFSHPLFWPILLFFLGSLISLVHTENLQRSMIVFCYIAFTMSIVLFFPLVIRKKSTLENIILALLLGYAFVCFFGIYQYLGDMVGLPQSLTGLRDLYTKKILGFTRVQSTALEPLYFANYLLIPASIIFIFFLKKLGPFRPSVAAGLFCLGCINIILTVSRGGYIALVAILAIILFWNFRQVLSVRTIGYFVVIIIIAFFVVTRFLNVGGVIDEFLSHVQNIFGGASYEERVQTFTIAREALLSHPWFGIGPGGFGPFASKHPFVRPVDGWLIVNNETLEILAEHGIFGFLSMVLILCIIFIRSIHTIKRSSDPYLKALLTALLAALFGILIQYQTFSVLYILHIWFLIGLMAVIWNIYLERKTS